MLKPDTLLQNRYNIIRHVGQGGMGAVYEASDQRLGNTVALKQMLLPSVESPPTDAIHSSMRRAFEREARILASLRHSALPRVIDHFVDPVGQFLVMEFIPGPDIGALHKERGGPFDLDKVLLWADQLLDALDYLHTQIPPVIHRDIKPQNLKPGPRGQLILLDFGLAKGLARAQAQSTTGNSLMGYTPQYAPLEQIEGGSVDVRSDLYSLAATLYHLVTNAPPADALQRATALLQGRTDPLRPAHEIVPGLPRAISAVLTQGLAMNPEARPNSAATMQQVLTMARQSGVMTDHSEPTEVYDRLSPEIAAAQAGLNPGHPAPRSGPTTPELHKAPRGAGSSWLWLALGALATLLLLGGVFALGRSGSNSVSTPSIEPVLPISAPQAAVTVVPTAQTSEATSAAIAQPATATSPSATISAPTYTVVPSPMPTTAPSTTPQPVAGFQIGQQVLTKVPDARQLMSAPSDGSPVRERPRLFGGAQVTILAIESEAVQVRTPEGVDGWIQQPAEQALTADLFAVGEQVGFTPGIRVQVVQSNGIPLRQEPRSQSPALIAKLVTGQQVTVEEILGDWLRVRLDDGSSGWMRWYYDGARYMDLVESQAPPPPGFVRNLSLQEPRLEGDDVQAVQQRLLDLGYTEVENVDGIYGPKAEAAVKHFQQLAGLVVDGVVGPRTWDKLFSEGAPPAGSKALSSV